MLCLKCGTENPNEQMFCTACGKRLPEASLLTVMTSPNIEDGLLREIKQIVADFKAGKISQIEFCDILQKHYENFENTHSMVQETAQEDDYESYSPDEMNFGYKGFRLWMEGLAELQEYSEIMDESIFSVAMKKIEEGNECINKAIYYNEIKRDTEGSSGFL